MNRTEFGPGPKTVGLDRDFISVNAGTNTKIALYHGSEEFSV
jgi:hypothetical protein